MKNIAIVSFGSGGTMGHMSLTTNLAKTLIKKGKRVILFSEYDYKNKSNIKGIKIIKIPSQKHQKTVGGKLDYKSKNILMKHLKENKIEAIIFSTFFDLDILEYAKNNKIKRILISYPLRESHRLAIKIRGYYKHFNRIFTLKDIVPIKKMFSNEIIVNPFLTKGDIIQTPNKNKRVLITCGGGGRPSAEIFFKIIKKTLPKIIQEKEINFTIIRGNSKTKFNKLPKTKIMPWSTNFSKLLSKHDIVISEAGYFTMVDLILNKKPAILIPGERRIDNQEQRAMEFERKGLGFFVLPIEKEDELLRKIDLILDNLDSKEENFNPIKEDIFNKPPIEKKILEELK